MRYISTNMAQRASTANTASTAHPWRSVSPREGAQWLAALADAEDNMWVYRRDRQIRRPLRSAIRRSAEGWPFLAPEIQLLFKSHPMRQQDHADFAATWPKLDIHVARGYATP
jgi:hypothetical protein